MPRTPLIISGRGAKSSDLYKQADSFVKRLKAKTIVAPRAVIPQVNKVAIKACIVGFKLIKNSTIYLPTLVLYETILI